MLELKQAGFTKNCLLFWCYFPSHKTDHSGQVYVKKHTPRFFFFLKLTQLNQQWVQLF